MTSETLTKFSPSRKGCLAVDPRGAHVVFEYAGRKFIGEVYGAFHDSVTGTIRLKVKHFCGDDWADPHYPDRPLCPPMFAVNVLIRYPA